MVNIAAHLACSWSVFALLRTVLVNRTHEDSSSEEATGSETQSRTDGWEEGELIAMVSGVLFLTSPLTIGTVTYVYGRAEVRVGVLQLEKEAPNVVVREWSTRILLACRRVIARMQVLHVE